MSGERVVFFFTVFLAISVVSGVTTIRVIDVARDSHAAASAKK